MTSPGDAKNRTKRIRETLVVSAAAIFAAVFAAVSGTSNSTFSDEDEILVVETRPETAPQQLAFAESQQGSKEVQSNLQIVSNSPASPQYVVVPFPPVRTRAS